MEQGRSPLSFQAVLELCRDRGDFRQFLSDTLRGIPLDSYFWECRPVKAATADRSFEFAVVPGSSLERFEANPTPFRSHFEGAPESATVVAFPNLGDDAQLIVPRPIGPLEVYPHLARFLRGAEREQIDELWRSLAEQALPRLGDAPVWISTAGLGVSWLHLRIDSRPKYYRHDPYRSDR